MFYYGIDLIDTLRGVGKPPTLVLLLAQRLPDDSATRALQRGGWQHFEWGQGRHMLADIYDAIAFNTEASGNWSKKVPELPRWPRPQGPVTQKPKRPRSVKELFASITQQQGK